MSKNKKENAYAFVSEQCGWTVLETKSGKRHFIEGYISTFDKDLYNDIVTEGGMDDMLSQLKEKNIKLDLDHETWSDDEGNRYDSHKNINPVGKIVDAEIDEVGLKVQAEINESSSRFKEVWNSIKGGFLDAFSIAYVPKKACETLVEGEKARLLDKVDLLNVALTGVPVNPHAKMTDVFMKSLKDFNKLEDTKMEETKNNISEKVASEVKSEAIVEATKEVVEEVKSKEVEVEKEAVEVAEVKEAVEAKSEVKSIDFEAELKSRDEAIDVLRGEISELKAKLAAPVMKSVKESAPKLEEKTAKLNPLDLIR